MPDLPVRGSELPSYLLYILLNPAFNWKAALLLYAMIGIFLLLVLVLGVMLLMRPPREEASEEYARVGAEGIERLEPGETFEGSDDEGAAVAHDEAPSPSARGRRRLTAMGAGILVLILVLAVTGYTTSDPALCKECHWPSSEHAKASPDSDPHASVSCISCHESGGLFGRYLTAVPARLVHFADNRSPRRLQEEYGRVSVAACSSCHEDTLGSVATDETRGLRVSHKEPLAASATCIDCHARLGGIVGAHNAGMAPCLRCHDEKVASAKCATCHDERAAAAARARTGSFSAARIQELSCGGCHDEERECDWCHGMRLPHTAEFMAYAHARAGAVDFWYNGGKTCSRCHNASRRPCQNCHGRQLGGAHGQGTTWLAQGHERAAVEACDTCHQRYAYAATRDFCEDLCHTPAAIASSPR